MNKTMQQIANAVAARTSIDLLLYRVAVNGDTTSVFYRGSQVFALRREGQVQDMEINMHGYPTMTTRKVINACFAGVGATMRIAQRQGRQVILTSEHKEVDVDAYRPTRIAFEKTSDH